MYLSKDSKYSHEKLLRTLSLRLSQYEIKFYSGYRIPWPLHTALSCLLFYSPVTSQQLTVCKAFPGPLANLFIQKILSQRKMN